MSKTKDITIIIKEKIWKKIDRNPLNLSKIEFDLLEIFQIHDPNPLHSDIVLIELRERGYNILEKDLKKIMKKVYKFKKFKKNE